MLIKLWKQCLQRLHALWQWICDRFKNIFGKTKSSKGSASEPAHTKTLAIKTEPSETFKTKSKPVNTLSAENKSTASPLISENASNTCPILVEEKNANTETSSQLKNALRDFIDDPMSWEISGIFNYISSLSVPLHSAEVRNLTEALLQHTESYQKNAIAALLTNLIRTQAIHLTRDDLNTLRIFMDENSSAPLLISAKIQLIATLTEKAQYRSFLLTSDVKLLLDILERLVQGPIHYIPSYHPIDDKRSNTRAKLIPEKNANQIRALSKYDLIHVTHTLGTLWQERHDLFEEYTINDLCGYIRWTFTQGIKTPTDDGEPLASMSSLISTIIESGIDDTTAAKIGTLLETLPPDMPYNYRTFHSELTTKIPKTQAPIVY